MTGRIPRTGVVALVPDRWDGIWMPRHQVMSRLTRHFRVVWVEPADNWRRYWLPGLKPETSVQNVSPEIPNFDRYVPGRWLPEVYKPRALGDFIRRRRLVRAVKRLQRVGCDRIVLYLWRPRFAWAADAVPTDVICYHIDDEYQFTSRDIPEDPIEVGLLRRVDLVIIHSPKLLEKKGGHNTNTMYVPNGVEYPLFSSPCAEPADLGAISRPRAGYVGVIKSQLDFGMLVDLCTRRSDWSF
ncbi:MAG TPA: hypothetical protein VNQ14_00630, partial [Woeseiaceae bacterium]|nr:hypothetical protein [Woeseiaceae bacterium]